MKWGRHEILHWLWLLLPLVGCAALLLRRRIRNLLSFADLETLRELAPGWRPERARRRLWLWAAAMLAGGMALAQPRWGYHWEEVKRRGLDILVVLDTSRSMTAQDIKPSRLQQAKWGIRDLVRKLKGDRIGLVAFAGSSFLQCPLTVDYPAFLLTLDDVYPGIIPRGGTAIEQALRTAMNSFEKNSSADRAIVLVTDGEDHEGRPESLIPQLKAKNIRVYAIGIGTREGDLIPAPDDAATAGFFKDRQGRVVKTALEEDVLQKLALETGGVYVRSAPGETGLEKVFDEGLANLKRDEGESKTLKSYEERFGWFIAAALLCLAVESLLTNGSRTREDQP